MPLKTKSLSGPNPAKARQIELSSTKIKLKNKKTHIFLYLVICFLIVIGAAELMTLASQSFEQSHRVEAETLPELPQEIKQNQTTNLLEDGYLME